MKGKTIAIGVVVVTVVAIIAIYLLVMATFKSDERSLEDVSTSYVSVMESSDVDRAPFM